VQERRWNDPSIRWVVSQFHKTFYAAKRRTWRNTYWRGVPVFKCPLDLWVYQEILHEVRPDVIIETGTLYGGSAYYLASICDLLEQGQVITIDIEPLPDRPSHPRLTYLTGSSTDPDVVAKVDARIGEGTRVLVVLDSDHSREHVLSELDVWHSRVSTDSYLIVEDTNINGHPVTEHLGPGPWEAVNEWLAKHPDFRRDPNREKFFLTFNPRGYLQRVA
jgi:cephalosporin hydroxylase